jgi:predicted MFS family arabinose efflux permease
MDRVERERRLLQKVVAIAGLVPVGAGLYGVVFGAALTGDSGMSVSGDSHYRYLSGLLLGIGLLFWSGIPGIERKKGRFQLLTLIVVVGGLARLGGLLLTGLPALTMLFALVMELIVTPAVCLWQMRVARQHPDVARLIVSNEPGVKLP